MGKELDAFKKLNEDHHGYTRQVENRDGQEHVGVVGQESKCTGLCTLVEYIGKSWDDFKQKNDINEREYKKFTLTAKKRVT